MADEKIGTKGNAGLKGNALKLVLNPPEAEKSGVLEDGVWVRAELNETGLTVRLFGQAKFGKRTISHYLDLTEETQPGLAPLKGALEQILEVFGDQLKTELMEHAYKARSFAVGQGEKL